MVRPNLRDLVCFSFATLTTAGFGDYSPVHPLARTLTTFEQIAGVLYAVILIARLAGFCSPTESER